MKFLFTFILQSTTMLVAQRPGGDIPGSYLLERILEAKKLIPLEYASFLFSDVDGKIIAGRITNLMSNYNY
jgi:hypothetical protein